MGLRQEKIADQIRDVIASTLTGGQMTDPRLESVTVTAVQVTADLQNAKVFFRVYDDRFREDADTAMKRASSYFRKKLAGQLDVRRVPEIRLVYDESVENAARIETLLSQIPDSEEN